MISITKTLIVVLLFGMLTLGFLFTFFPQETINLIESEKEYLQGVIIP